MSIGSEIARIASAIDDQTGLIDQIKTALSGKAAGEGSGGTGGTNSLQDKTVTPPVWRGRVTLVFDIL